MKIALFIPTYNAILDCQDRFAKTLQIIKDAMLDKVLIIDSSSTDNTLDLVKSFDFDYHVIPKDKFDHGGTRQLALEMLSDMDIIIYITQDVYIESQSSITNLTKIFFENPKIAGCYGRQLPHTHADIFARHLRLVNYPDLGYVRGYSDRYVFGIRCVFSSDSFAAYKTEALKKIGGFPDHIIFGEDVYVFAKFLQSGYKIAYAADAICYHSHNNTILEDFRRYFDIGVFHRSENWILQDFGYASKEGLKFTLSEWRFLTKKPWLWPKSIFKLMAKYIGYKLGYNYDSIGVRLCRKLTLNKNFWW